MKKWFYVFICSLIPVIALAADPNTAGALSFAPTQGDYSIIFLGNLFGVVDGVLHGTGSQIMGNMFGIFNAAVLALGGLTITYTVGVSTMNTAHEGQFLGQKWSSIWIPVRSTLGLALIIPKASGYCLMQIIVMWIVVQGVGAADKVWDSALSYLNRGGVIIKSQQSTVAFTNGKSNPTLNGAYAMLVGQVCMGVLQNQLSSTRDGYLNAKNSNLGGACATENTKDNIDLKKFCTTPVPDFIGSVDFISAQTGTSPYLVKMPNFDKTSPYSVLNGICGTIKWERFGDADCALPAKIVPANTPLPITPAGQGKPGCGLLSDSDMDALAKARPIALTAMFNDLSNIAQIIVNNIPKEATGSNLLPIQKPSFSEVAIDQLGVPYTASGTICTKYSDKCIQWGSAAGTNSSPLFNNGAEFLYSVLDYNSIMQPNLNLVEQLKDIKKAKDERKFIEESRSQGWIMAGSYYFDLVTLNGNASKNSTLDLDNGLDASIYFKSEDITSAFTDTGCGTGTYRILCTWLGQSSKVKPLLGVIDGQGYPTIGNVPQPSFLPTKSSSTVSGNKSSTINGYVQNSVLIQLPGQPGLSIDQFAKFPDVKLDTKITPLKSMDFDCGWVLFFCLGRTLGEIFWNFLVLGIYQVFMDMLAPIIASVVNTFVMIPLTSMSGIFIKGIQTVAAPGVNPIMALADMGATYINSAGDMWLNMLLLSISTSIIPFIGKFVFALITLSMPIVIAWLGAMMGVGFITAYYIPILPFLIFIFASIGWMIAVIEAMVAAPIVALGITHPEGHDAFGKGEQAIMILMNVFLRPAMMIIGYIAGISLSYVGVWLLNAGFQHAIGYVVGIPFDTVPLSGLTPANSDATSSIAPPTTQYGYGPTWAGIYAFFFSVLAYTSAYLTIVQKSFTLIHYLPDKVLRWIGGQPEGIGGETAAWTDEARSQIKEGGDKTGAAQGKIGEKLGGSAERGMEKLKDNAAKVASAGSAGVSTAPPEKKRE